MAGAERREEVSTLLHKGFLVRVSWDTQGNQRPSRYSTSAGRSPMSMVRINGNNTYNISRVRKDTLDNAAQASELPLLERWKWSVHTCNLLPRLHPLPG